MQSNISERVICFNEQVKKSAPIGEEAKRCVYVMGKMWVFTDKELWEILEQRGALEKIVLKFDAQTGVQRGFAFAVYQSEEEVERVLVHGQDVENTHGHLWLEKGQRNANTAFIRGGKTLFVEYSRRVEAELAKSSLSRRFTGEGGIGVHVSWVDSKILNNCLIVKFSQEENDASGRIVNESSITQAFVDYGAVQRVEFVRDRWNNVFGEALVFFSNTASGQIV
ncbi:MAG: hypothetical protein EZS28_026429 [Streblomastix strix]|uniref:RRM domain-containing protein n=1 Tax=Streblomastix strix TaxID=222440 RepID=A0A5J4V6J8_9EUKA|nr:MAG: hypothetical protein EZS28_026429 [Streblomastix strix]